MLGRFETQHEVDQGVAILLDHVGGALVVDAVLMIQRGHYAPLIELPRQGVGGAHLEQMAGNVCVEQAAFVRLVDILEILGLGEGIASGQFPVRGQLALHLQLNTLAAHLARCLVARGGRIGGAQALVGDGLGAVFLVDLENRRRCVQRAVEVFALEAQFIVLASDRRYGVTRGIQAALRFEDIGVADIDAVMLIQVVDKAGVLGDMSSDLQLALGSLVGRAGLVVVPVQSAAENQFQRVGHAKSGAGIEAIELGIGVLPAVFVLTLRFRCGAGIPVVDVDVALQQDIVGHVTVEHHAPVAGTYHQFVIAVHQAKWATGVRVEAVLGFPVVPGTDELIISLRGGAAEQVGAEHVQIGPGLGGRDVEFPSVVQDMLQRGIG